MCCPPLSVADVKAMSCGVKPIPASSVSAFQCRLSRSVAGSYASTASSMVRGINGFWQVLLNARHQTVSGQCDGSGSRGVCAVQHLQQRTFAAAVVAQQANTVAFFSA